MTIPGHPTPPTAPPGEGSTLPYGEAANTAKAADSQTGRKAPVWRDGERPSHAPDESGVFVKPPDSAPAPEAANSASGWIRAAGEEELAREREATPYPRAEQGPHNGIILTLGWIEQVLTLTLPPDVQVRVAGVGKSWKLCVNEKQIVDVISSMAHYVRRAMPDGGTLTMHCMPMTIKDAETSARLDLKPGKYVYLGISHTHKAGGESTTSDKPNRARLGLDTCFRLVGELGGAISVDRKSQGMTALNIYLPAVD